MLLTLSISSLRRVLTGSGGTVALTDVPAIAADELGLRGLALETSLLAGVDLSVVDDLRDAADKAPCPCLFLVEDQAHPLGDPDEDRVEPSMQRIERVLRVAHRLGCSAVALTVASPGTSLKNAISTEEHLDFVAARIKELVKIAERLELNMLVEPEPGRQQPPDQVTALIRRVGGFRIGSCPDFATATEHDDPVQYLRALVPYASAVGVPTSHQPIPDPDGAPLGAGGPGAYDLSASIAGVRAVGYDAALLIKHRSASDPMPAIEATRQALEQILSQDTPSGD
ncbi:MAG: sugar phosphate isomerase/epimerase family protein [Phycisphaerales bacterium]